MCEGKDTCQRAKEFPGVKPEECSAEQIKICHGDEKNHPCVEKAKDPQ